LAKLNFQASVFSVTWSFAYYSAA